MQVQADRIRINTATEIPAWRGAYIQDSVISPVKSRSSIQRIHQIFTAQESVKLSHTSERLRTA